MTVTRCPPPSPKRVPEAEPSSCLPLPGGRALTSLVSCTDDESPGLYGFLNVIVHSASGFKQSSSRWLVWGVRWPDPEPEGAGTREVADRPKVWCSLTPAGSGVAFQGGPCLCLLLSLQTLGAGSCPLQAGRAIVGSGFATDKEISPECSSEGLMLKLKLQYFGHLMRRADSLEKTLMLGKIEGRRRRG